MIGKNKRISKFFKMLSFLFFVLVVLISFITLPSEVLSCPYCGVSSGVSGENAGSSIVRNFAILSGVLISFLGIGTFILLYVIDIVRKEEKHKNSR